MVTEEYVGPERRKAQTLAEKAEGTPGLDEFSLDEGSLLPSDRWATDVLRYCRERVVEGRGRSSASTANSPRTPSTMAGTPHSPKVPSMCSFEVVVPRSSWKRSHSRGAKPRPAAEPLVSETEKRPMASEMTSKLPELVQKAYRLDLPCASNHTTVAGPTTHCAAAPRCTTEMQSLRGDVRAVEECLRYLMGPQPPGLAPPECAEDAGRGAVGSEGAPTWAMAPTHPCLWRGIRNLGNTCYLNAVMQLLFGVGRVRRAVGAAWAVDAAAAPPGPTELERSGLGELLAEMGFSRDGRGADAGVLADFFSIERKTQQDAQEFFTLLVDWLRQNGGAAVREATERSLEGAMLYDRCCAACGRSAKRTENFLSLSLPVRPSLAESLEAFLRPEEVEGFICPRCGATGVAVANQYLRALPEVLVLHLSRFEFDVRTLQRGKILSAVRFPHHLDMTPYTNRWHEARATETGPTAGPQYELRGVLNHLGESALSGHYTYDGRVPLTRPGGGEAAAAPRVWLSFNDALVTRERRYDGGEAASSRDAYVLVYHRLPDASTPEAADAAPSPGDFAPRVLRQVERVNRAVDEQRAAWRRQREDLEEILRRWSMAAQSVFDGATPPSSMDAAYCLPTVWLQRFGRCFLSTYVAAHQFGSLARSTSERTPRDARADPEALAPSSPTAVSGRGGPSGLEFPPAHLPAPAPMMEQGNGTHATALLKELQNQQLEESVALIACPHGRIAPWAAYKVVSSAAAALLRDFVSFCQERAAEAPASPTSVSARPAGLSRFHLGTNHCLPCMELMARSVLTAAHTVATDETALGTTGEDGSSRTAGALSLSPPTTPLTGEEGATGRGIGGTVYVSDVVWSACESYAQENRRMLDQVGPQGFTGLYSLRSRPPSAPAPKNDQLDALRRTLAAAIQAGEEEAGHAIGVRPRLLCEHGQLKSGAPVRTVSETARRYWVHRLTSLLDAAHGSASAATASLPWAAMGVSVEQSLLPCVPVSETGPCRRCAERLVRDTAVRHHARLRRMDEIQHFPTLWQAGARWIPGETSPARAPTSPEAEEPNDASHHPNALFFAQPVKSDFERYAQEWTELHAAQVQLQRAKVGDQHRAELRQRERCPSLPIKTIARRPLGRTGRPPPGGAPAVAASSTDLPTTTRTTTMAAAAVEEGSPLTPLQAAEAELRRLEAETLPPSQTCVGCVPAWWVARWHAQLSAGEAAAAAMPPLPPLDWEVFRCPHGRWSLEVDWLNPLDRFWTPARMRQAHRLWVPPDEDPRARPGPAHLQAADLRPALWFPPLILVPMKELLELHRLYGPEDGLRSAPQGSTGAVEGEAAPTVNPERVLVVAVWNGERTLLSGRCEICCGALLDRFEVSCRNFTYGSLRLQLHIRKSKRQFYDSLSVFPAPSEADSTEGGAVLHHSTTLRELRHLLGDHIAQVHDYVVPVDQLEFIHGRKPLRRRQGATNAAVAGETAAASMEEATLQDLGIQDGDRITVNLLDTCAVPRSRARPAVEGEVWEDIPAHLLHGGSLPAAESEPAFGDTRLLQGGPTSPRRGDAVREAKEAPPGIACSVCTFYNAPGMIRCEMCEALLCSVDTR